MGLTHSTISKTCKFSSPVAMHGLQAEVAFVATNSGALHFVPYFGEKVS